MATLLRYAAELRDENPYAAPQTRDMVLPLAMEQSEQRATRTAEVLPRSTQRWLNAALAVYALSFVVPLFTSVDRWTPFIGIFFFFMAALMCWHPLMWCWWANLFFYLSRRNLYRGHSQRACVYAGIGALAAASLMVIGLWSGRRDDYFMNLTLNPPYLCWLAAMLLQWIAAVDMRFYNKQQDRPGRQLRPRDLL